MTRSSKALVLYALWLAQGVFFWLYTVLFKAFSLSSFTNKIENQYFI